MKQDSYFAFLRHGSYQQKPNVPSAWQPYPLDPSGVTQSVQATKTLVDFAQHHQLTVANKIHCSTLLRAWQTAKTLTDHLPNPTTIVSHAQLNERSVGALANLSVDEIDQILQQDPRFEHPGFAWKADSYYRLPFDGAESLIEAGHRVADYIQQTLHSTAAAQQLQIFVGHGASFRHAAFHMGILSFEQIAHYSMHYAQPLFFKWDAQTQRFQHLDGQWKLRAPKDTTDFKVYRSLTQQTVTQEVMQWLD